MNFKAHIAVAAGLAIAASVWAHEETPTGRQTMLDIETADLPQGRVRIAAGERTHPPGARTPWHTSGPKLIHLMEGTLTAYGLGGKVLASCAPAPKLCFFSPGEEMWFFRNTGSVPMRFLLISVDSLDKPTVHEAVGQVMRISGKQVTLAAGDVRTAELASPARELRIDVAAFDGIGVGDYVATVRHEEKQRRARGLVKLPGRWQ
ncbi:MAG: hypothetical protein NT123_16755 [Proteobacteria bacterium]|nr:hypothetical protein [Pseudomonadota bacterium]